MKVRELWRYPVKSLQGERLDAAELGTTGIVGDRGYALFDRRTGLGLTARRVPELLFAAASANPDGTVRIVLPDGSAGADDEALSAWLDRPVALRPAAAVTERVYENPSDFEHEADAPWDAFDGTPGAFHDSVPLSLLSTATLAGQPVRRFRPNVLLEGSGEDELVGSVVRLGDAVLGVRNGLTRCVMVTRPQPGGLDRDLDVLRRIHRERDGRLAVGAVVERTGTVRVGDPVLR